jgi:hypothetical protein
VFLVMLLMFLLRLEMLFLLRLEMLLESILVMLMKVLMTNKAVVVQNAKQSPVVVVVESL